MCCSSCLSTASCSRCLPECPLCDCSSQSFLVSEPWTPSCSPALSRMGPVSVGLKTTVAVFKSTLRFSHPAHPEAKSNIVNTGNYCMRLHFYKRNIKVVSDMKTGYLRRGDGTWVKRAGGRTWCVYCCGNHMFCLQDINTGVRTYCQKLLTSLRV